VALL
jgi:hypothetical protein